MSEPTAEQSMTKAMGCIVSIVGIALVLVVAAVRTFFS